MIYWPTKTVASVRDLGLDWGPTLSKRGDPSIVSSLWTRLRGTATIGSNLIEGTRTLARVSGGTANTETVFRNQVTLSNGEILDEDVFLKTRA